MEIYSVNKGAIVINNSIEPSWNVGFNDDADMNEVKYIADALNNYEKLQQINKELIGELEYFAIENREDLISKGYWVNYLDKLRDLIAKAKEVTK